MIATRRVTKKRHPLILLDERRTMPYNRDKGKGKQWESAPRLRCFICDCSHLTRVCLKREALKALIKKNEKEEDEEARLSSIQMLGALQFMPKASLQGSEAR